MEKIIVFDFDKTLTNYDTTGPFFKFCANDSLIKRVIYPFFLLVKLMSKISIITVKREKEIGLKFFCPSNYSDFKIKCKQFSDTVELNSIYHNDYMRYCKNEKFNVLIVSASFSDYLKEIFPEAIVYGSTLIVEKNEIKGLKDHPFNKEKVEILRKNGIEEVEVFFTDSKNDLPVVNISKKTYWVKNSKIV